MSDVPLDTVLRQRRAADPGASAWVSANAGAGKTRVLTDRVVRLLLAGALPARILCLTFTKAAAAEMTLRVFHLLAGWVTMPRDDLVRAIEALTGERPDGRTLARARRLFARAVETPGGLKIETIHAFCERLLHLVPFEAGVSPRFQVLDDSQAGEMLAAARNRVLVRAASGRDPALAWALGIVGIDAAGDALAALLDGAVADPAVPGDADGREAALGRLRALFGLAPDENPGAVRDAMLEGGPSRAARRDLAAALRRTGKANDAKRAAALDAAVVDADPEAALASYLTAFFKSDGDPRSDKDLATKGVDPAASAALAAERDRLAALMERLRAAETLERTDALYRLAAAIRAGLEAEKARLGALDFADLIRRVLLLLDRAEAAAWVLYKLDRGIDHVLVDEAQDTNADQWEILRRLTEDFAAGAGRPTTAPRTVFAVGDPKQSIYSFQGANPRLFEEGRKTWRDRTRAADLPFEDVRLTLSFRSAPAILHAVDDTFGVEAHFQGLAFDASSVTVHESLRDAAPGSVEIWPTVERPARGAAPDAWAAPVDEPDADAPAIVVAKRVAEAVRHWTGEPAGAGRVRPGDVLILVRSRGPAFFAVIRALKAAGIAVAGADRLDVGEHIAVNDLVAAGEAALRPENDLALAAALKSPLGSLDEDDLFRIAHDRAPAESLAAALDRHAASGDPRAGQACETLRTWRGLAREGPFGFYARLLGPGGGRRRLVERLGGEAADAIDAFLSYAEAAEAGPETPSLTAFLARFASAEHTIKRDLGAAADEVRVMTVHGAKGLEAPLVVVIDGCETAGREPRLVPVACGTGDALPVWSPRQGGDPAAVAEAREAARALRLEEHHRLLYVAMTRARDRLVVAPFAGAQKETEQAWCAMIRRGFADGVRSLAEVDLGYGPVALWRSGDEAPSAAAVPPEEAAEAEPDWLRRPVAPEPAAPLPIRPSEAGRTVAPGAGDAARRRGTLIHAAIEHAAPFPDAAREAAVAAFLSARAGRLDAAERDALAAEALGVIRHPALAALFAPGARSEVPVIGRLARPDGGTIAVSGRVDRLVVGEAVLAAEFKSGPPDPADREQLALYRALLAEAFPDRPVRVFLVGTAGPVIVEPEDADLDRALRNALA